MCLRERESKIAMAAVGEGPAILGVTAIKPVERHGWEAVKFFFWDPKRGAVMGRTPKSWGLITSFYVVYYLCLAAFWALMFAIFYTTLSDARPKYGGNDDGLVGTNPGLGVRPSQPSETVDSSMIIYNMEEEDLDKAKGIMGYKSWSERIYSYLDDSNYTTTDPEHLQDCSSIRNEQEFRQRRKNCEFYARELGPCQHQPYGYESASPCVYLKLNRILGVANEHYVDEEGLPELFPPELEEHIKRQENREQVWVDCHGEQPLDAETLRGKIRYYPESRGFPGHYFPFLTESTLMNEQNQLETFSLERYESPLVAVQFSGLPVGQLVHVECRAWAKNVEYDRMHRKGMVRFELMVLDDEHACKFGRDGFPDDGDIRRCQEHAERRREERKEEAEDKARRERERKEKEKEEEERKEREQ